MPLQVPALFRGDIVEFVLPQRGQLANADVVLDRSPAQVGDVISIGGARYTVLAVNGERVQIRALSAIEADEYVGTQTQQGYREVIPLEGDWAVRQVSFDGKSHVVGRRLTYEEAQQLVTGRDPVTKRTLVGVLPDTRFDRLDGVVIEND